MEYKKCKTCGIDYPATKEYFYENKELRDGLYSDCKTCLKARRQSRKAEIKEYGKRWRDKNKSRLQQQSKEYYHANKELIREKHREWLSRSAEKQRQKRRENKEALSKKHKEWIEKHPEYYKTYYHAYKIRNPAAIRSSWQKRAARKSRLPALFTSEQWDNALRWFGHRCAYCGNDGPLQQEHFIPLCRGGPYTKDNVIPACRSCNCSKNKYSFFAWYPKQKFYSECRVQRILAFFEAGKSVI